MMSEKEHHVETTLDHELYKMFQKVKESTGLTKNSEVLRLLIANEYERVTGSKRITIPFSAQDRKQVEKWAKKLGMEPQEFIETSVRKFLAEKEKSESKKSSS